MGISRHESRRITDSPRAAPTGNPPLCPVSRPLSSSFCGSPWGLRPCTGLLICGQHPPGVSLLPAPSAETLSGSPPPPPLFLPLSSLPGPPAPLALRWVQPPLALPGPPGRPTPLVPFMGSLSSLRLPAAVPPATPTPPQGSQDTVGIPRGSGAPGTGSPSSRLFAPRRDSAPGPVAPRTPRERPFGAAGGRGPFGGGPGWGRAGPSEAVGPGVASGSDSRGPEGVRCAWARGPSSAGASPS